jgi:hypothetical protein
VVLGGALSAFSLFLPDSFSVRVFACRQRLFCLWGFRFSDVYTVDLVVFCFCARVWTSASVLVVFYFCVGVLFSVLCTVDLVASPPIAHGWWSVLAAEGVRGGGHGVWRWFRWWWIWCGCFVVAQGVLVVVLFRPEH